MTAASDERRAQLKREALAEIAAMKKLTRGYTVQWEGDTQGWRVTDTTDGASAWCKSERAVNRWIAAKNAALAAQDTSVGMIIATVEWNHYDDRKREGK